MQSADFFIALFLAIGVGFGALAIWARGQVRQERRMMQAGAGRRRQVFRAEISASTVAEIDREIAQLRALRARLVD